MGSGAVGLNPIGGSVRGLVDRHNHAALGEPPMVLVFVCGINPSIITMLVTLEEFGKVQWSQDGCRARGDPDFSQREKRCFFHGICGGSIVGRQEHGGNRAVLFGDDIELRAIGSVINGEQAEALLER